MMIDFAICVEISFWILIFLLSFVVSLINWWNRNSLSFYTDFTCTYSIIFIHNVERLRFQLNSRPSDIFVGHQHAIPISSNPNILDMAIATASVNHCQSLSSSSNPNILDMAIATASVNHYHLHQIPTY